MLTTSAIGQNKFKIGKRIEKKEKEKRGKRKSHWSLGNQHSNVVSYPFS